MKRELYEIWRAFEASEKSGAPNCLDGMRGIVFDGRSACFTSGPLPRETILASLIVVNRGTSRITINDGAQIGAMELAKWSGGAVAHQSDAYETLATFNVLVMHALAMRGYPVTKSRFFVRDFLALHLERQHRVETLPGGVDLWRGFTVGVRPTASGLVVNVNTSTGAFVTEGDLIRVIHRYLELSPSRNLQDTDITPSHRIRLNRLFKNVRVEVHIGADRKQRRMKGLSDRSTLQYTFEVEGRLISVEGRFLSKAASGHNINSTFNGPKLSPQDFMKREYGIELRHPHLPCVEINAHVVYPVELVSFCRYLPSSRNKLHVFKSASQASSSLQSVP